MTIMSVVKNRRSMENILMVAKSFHFVGDQKAVAKKAADNKELLDAYKAIGVLLASIMDIDRQLSHYVDLSDFSMENERRFRELIMSTREGNELLNHLKIVNPELFDDLRRFAGHQA